jgi:N4-gp56 family major capsid protein
MAVTLTSTLTQTIIGVYSKDIWFQAQPVLRFEQFAVQRTDLSVQPGLSMYITVYDNLPAGGALTENVAITTQALSTSQISITVTEYGNAVSVSELLLQASFDDVMGSAAKLLGIDYAKTLDGVLRGVALGGTQVVYAGNKSSRATVAAGDFLTSKEIKDAVEVLATNNAAKYNNDYYVLFTHPHHARKLRDDGTFQNVTSYGKQYAGEIGRIDDVVIIETTQMPKLTGAGASGADVYQAVIFGENAYGLAIALPVEMRDGGIIDFGRTHSLAWYAIFGAGRLIDKNIVRIETN